MMTSEADSGDQLSCVPPEAGLLCTDNVGILFSPWRHLNPLMADTLTSQTDSKPAHRWSLGAFLLTVCKGVLSLAGLMSLTPDLIEWRRFLADVVTFYQSVVSVPLRRAFQRFAYDLNIEIDWIPPWFYNYLPIASVFTFGLLHAYAEMEGTNQISLFCRLVRDIYRDFRKEGLETLLQIPIMLAFGLILALAAPIFVIVFPCLLIAYFVAGVALLLILWGTMILFAIHRVIPLISVVLLFILTIWLFVSEDSLHKTLASFRRNTSRKFIRMRHAARKAWRKAPETIRKEMPKFRTEVKSSLDAYIKLIINQYRFAGILISLYLIIVSVNYAFL